LMPQKPSAQSHDRSAGVGTRAELARAKVNLTLEIKGKRPDGYHELESLVLFADFGDIIEYRPGGAFSLSVTGPFAAVLHGDNLIERAARIYGELSGTDPGGEFYLTKHIPVAAGLGGGSADAAAALRLLMARGKPVEAALLLEAASRIGADVPCCLRGSAAIMTGIGDRLHPIVALAPVPAVLVNPMMPLSTSDVFRELGAEPLSAAPAKPLIPKFTGVGDIAAYAKARANDLEAPACRLLPVIGDILAALDAAPGALLSRLSGSGPTCFALFANAEDAAAGAAAIRREYPGWWIRAVSLS
jgi:4-diphosphocytidyl-2-C-methyl-D-erythritol kinase